jgi:hypothetical protein
MLGRRPPTVSGNPRDVKLDGVECVTFVRAAPGGLITAYEPIPLGLRKGSYGA